MIRIVRKDEATLRRISPEKIVWNFISKEISKDVSLAVTEATEDFSEKEICANNRIYYVPEGNMNLEAGGRSELLHSGDSIFISRGTEYEMSGAFKAAIVNQPAFGTEL